MATRDDDDNHIFAMENAQRLFEIVKISTIFCRSSNLFILLVSR